MGAGTAEEPSACKAERYSDQKRCLDLVSLSLLELNVSWVGKGADVGHQRLATRWFSQMRAHSLANCPSLC